MQTGLKNFFRTFVKKESLFVNKQALQLSYSPEKIIHRDDLINSMANMLAPVLRMEKPSNIFIYGKTGTGKTLVTMHVTSELQKIIVEMNLTINIAYINCKLKRVADTEYRLIAQMAKKLGRELPPTGLPTDEIYNMFTQILESQEQIFIIILDEIDHLIKKAGDNILYNLTRINADLKKSQISIIGISNDPNFTEYIDPRVKSSLNEEDIIFSPYNAIQLQEIIKERSDIAFKENALAPGVVSKCAAYSAREHGDARRALELIRVAGEIAERSNSPIVAINHLDEAEQKIEKDTIFEIIKNEPKQFQAVLYSIMVVCSKKSEHIFTGEIYEYYKALCEKASLRPLTQRRVSDVIGELDMQGIINANVISKGRHGRTREIALTIPETSIPKIKQLIEESLDVKQAE